MRIVYVTQRLPFGDGETFVVPEIEALLAAGHERADRPPPGDRDPVLHNDARRAPAPDARAARRGAASPARSPRRSPVPLDDTAAAFWGVRRTRPRRRALANVQAAAEGMWVGRIARAWGADHIHAHWAHLTATLAMSASMATGIPWSFTAHRYDVILNNLLTEKLRSARFGRFIAREMLAIASRYVPQDALARAVVLHMGVALAAAARAGRIGARGADRPLPCTARGGQRPPLPPRGGCPARGSRGCRQLRLAGDGPEEEAVRRHTEQLGLENRVRMLGTVPHEELMRSYRERRVDCVVPPSLDLGGGLHEGLSVALVEAMAHGVPVIGTRTGGLPEAARRLGRHAGGSCRRRCLG